METLSLPQLVIEQVAAQKLQQPKRRASICRERIGFYGLDLYGLYGSIQLVLSYLDKTDPQAALRAR